MVSHQESQVYRTITTRCSQIYSIKKWRKCKQRRIWLNFLLQYSIDIFFPVMLICQLIISYTPSSFYYFFYWTVFVIRILIIFVRICQFFIHEYRLMNMCIFGCIDTEVLYNRYIYSLTCIKRLLLGQRKCGLIRQVTS